MLNLSTLLHQYRHPTPTNTLMYLTPRSTFFYLPVTLFIDLLFVISIWGYSGRLSGEASLSDYCQYIRVPDTGFDVQACERWRLALRILCEASVCMAVVVG
jgi:hypothetical protein